MTTGQIISRLLRRDVATKAFFAEHSVPTSSLLDNGEDANSCAVDVHSYSLHSYFFSLFFFVPQTRFYSKSIDFANKKNSYNLGIIVIIVFQKKHEIQSTNLVFFPAKAYLQV